MGLRLYPPTRSGAHSNLIELVRHYRPFPISNPLHGRREYNLDVGVERFYEQNEALIQSKPHLVLELQNSDSVDRRFRFNYSQLELSLSSPLVKEIYDSLRNGKKARFKGRLTIHTDWALIPPTREVTGELTGELAVDGRTYHTNFTSKHHLEIRPYLRQISPKSQLSTYHTKPPKSF
ncbi:hypothetical protein HYX05_03530 [Candidatus Woesearchaeota archaeon]|nr:hypothetical protein [Candidatus Woesearchaeota archaeon]